jgi:peptidoglycan/xylan/chitin deacetylase (PgdA/CDA1 family)
MLLAVNFHYVRPVFDDPFPGIHGVTPRQFEAQLELLGKLGVYVSAEQILRAIQGRMTLPEHALVVTFDDGLREQYETAWPVLQRMGIPAIFFINTAPILHATVSTVHKIHMIRASFPQSLVLAILHEEAARLQVAMDMPIEDTKVLAQYKYDEIETARLKYLLNFLLSPRDRDTVIEACFQRLFSGSEAQISQCLYMDVPQIKTLSSYGCIGTHAHEHVPLGTLPSNLAQAQIELSCGYLTDWTGESPFALSYPYGSIEACSHEAANHARRVGIQFAFTMERAANCDLERPMFLARFSNSDLPGGNASKWTIDRVLDALPQSGWYREPEVNICK